jgi:glycerophosphoryl diester phosphodiesterase
MRKVLKRLLYAILIISEFLWLNNTSAFVKMPEEQAAKLIAHRGVHQIYSGNNRANDSCQAEEIEDPTHSHIENYFLHEGRV